MIRRGRFRKLLRMNYFLKAAASSATVFASLMARGGMACAPDPRWWGLSPKERERARKRASRAKEVTRFAKRDPDTLRMADVIQNVRQADAGQGQRRNQDDIPARAGIKAVGDISECRVEPPARAAEVMKQIKPEAGTGRAARRAVSPERCRAPSKLALKADVIPPRSCFAFASQRI